MSKKIPSYKELQEQLSRLKAELDSIRKGEADLLIGDKEPLIIRFKSAVEEKERLQAEMELMANQWQTTFDTVKDVIFILDSDFRILRCNKASESFFNQNMNDIQGKHCYEIVHCTGNPVDCCPVLRIHDSLKRETGEFFVSGRWLEITVDPIIGPDNRLSGAVHILSDVTERKEAERKIALSEERYRIISGLISDYVYSFNVTSENELRGEWVSDSFVKVFGFTKDEIDARGGWQSMVYPEDLPEMIKHVQKVLEGSKDIFEVRFKTRKGEIRWLRDYATPVWDEEGRRIIKIYGTSQDITEIKKLELEKKESEIKYKAIFDATGTATLIVGEDTTIIMANNECYSITGYSPEELIGRKWTMFAAPESLQEMLNYHVLRRKDTSLAPKKYEVRLINKYNEVRDALLDIGMIPGTSQSVVSILDITDRKKAERELRESEEAFRKLFEDHIAVKLLINPETGDIIDANKSAEKFYGWSLDELKSMKIQQINTLPPEAVIAEMEKAKTNKRVYFEFKHRLADGSVKDVEVYSSAVNIKGGVYLHSIIHDVTEKKVIEKSLQQSEENFKRSVDESPLGIRIVNDAGKTVYANKALLDMFEVKNIEEYNSLSSRSFHTAESYMRHQERKEKRKRGEETSEYDIEIVLKDGRKKYVHVNRNEILWNGIRHYLVINQDITKQKELTLALMEAKQKAEESDRLKTAFLHNISHEIRTPLNAIVGFSAMLAEPGIDDETRLSFQETITRSSDQLLAIINDIIEISNIEAGIIKLSKSEVNINHLIHGLYNQYLPKAKAKNLEFRKETPLPEADAVIITDNSKTNQILTNLLNNAFKFTSQGIIQLGYKPDNEYIKFYVSDTGIGIPADKHDKVFERFYQVEHDLNRQYEGTGLGLSIAKSFVGLLGGEIWVESEPEKGSTFYFTLPRINPGTKNMPAHAEPEKFSPGREINILVAEDDEASLTLFGIYLDLPDVNLIKAVNGKEAVDYCKSGKPVDLVFMDIKMPVMDGYEATSIIRSLRPDLPVIMQSAYCDDADKAWAIEAGSTDFITKPFRKDIIISKIREYLQ